MMLQYHNITQVGTDIVRIDLSEETTNILHAVTLIMMNVMIVMMMMIIMIVMILMIIILMAMMSTMIG